MNARARVGDRVKPVLTVMVAAALVEIVASTIFGIGIGIIFILDGAATDLVLSDLFGIIVGMNTFVLALEVATFDHVGPVLIFAATASYVLAIVGVALVARRLDLVDVRSTLEVIRQ